LPSKHTKIIPVVSVMGLPSKNLTNALKICQFFRFGLHPYKLATLCNYRTHYDLVLSHKTYQNQGICYITIAYYYVTKTLWPAINFLMWKWPATLKTLGRPAIFDQG